VTRNLQGRNPTDCSNLLRARRSSVRMEAASCSMDCSHSRSRANRNHPGSSPIDCSNLLPVPHKMGAAAVACSMGCSPRRSPASRNLPDSSLTGCSNRLRAHHSSVRMEAASCSTDDSHSSSRANHSRPGRNPIDCSNLPPVPHKMGVAVAACSMGCSPRRSPGSRNHLDSSLTGCSSRLPAHRSSARSPEEKRQVKSTGRNLPGM
jgi:hypothetical protein